jgi:serine/threonine protein phosphatase PrpC
MLRTAILNGLETANGRVQSVGIGTATTLAVVEVVDYTVRPYHVGDSMILVVGQRGKIKLQTTSHSPVGFAVEAGLLDEIEAMHHEDRHLVSNVIGSAEMTIEIGTSLRLAPRDTVLLASDGLFDNLFIQEIVDRIRKGPLDQAVERLATDSRRRMLQPEPGSPSKPDDLTIVALRRLPGPCQVDAALAADVEQEPS